MSLYCWNNSYSVWNCQPPQAPWARGVSEGTRQLYKFCSSSENSSVTRWIRSRWLFDARALRWPRPWMLFESDLQPRPWMPVPLDPDGCPSSPMSCHALGSRRRRMPCDFDVMRCPLWPISIGAEGFLSVRGKVSYEVLCASGNILL